MSPKTARIECFYNIALGFKDSSMLESRGVWIEACLYYRK